MNPMDSRVIDVEQLRFVYPTGEFAIRVSQLIVEGGDTLAIVGPSGSGKTTLIHLLSGILPAVSGSIRVVGLDLADLGPEDRRDLRILKLGLVFQELELIEYLDVLDNVVLPYRISPILAFTRDVRERAVSLLRDLGLGNKTHRFPTRLSLGERQRVALSRALITQPALVLGDEPTANLDSENRDRVLDMLFRYSRETGAPLVVSSHDRALVQRFGRRLDVRDLA